MATRVYLFLEENGFELAAWDNASEEILRCVNQHRITVRQGRNRNHADLAIHCPGIGMAIHYSICDLRQERSPMLESINNSVIEDSTDENFDFWDTIPPFGVVELYDIRLERGKDTSDAELTAFCRLLDRFLLKHFMMYVFLETEIAPIRSYMLSSINLIRTFTHDGVTGYRVSNY